MKIVFGNQKGGVGKSTLCFMYANYLANVKNHKIGCLDFDSQKSLYQQWYNQKESFDGAPPYNVYNCDINMAPEIMTKIKKADIEYILIDMPGAFNNNNLVSIYKEADLIICPYQYDYKSYESTYVFSDILRTKLNIEAPILYIANRIRHNVTYPKADKMDKALQNFGILGPKIIERKSIQYQNLFDSEDESIVLNNEQLEEIYKISL